MEGGGGAKVETSVLNEGDGVVAVGIEAVAPHEIARCVGLARGEAEAFVLVSGDDELYGGVAEVADTIEEDNGLRRDRWVVHWNRFNGLPAGRIQARSLCSNPILS